MKLAQKRMRVSAKWVVKRAIFKIESHPASREEPWIEPFFICLLAWLERKNERLWSLNSYMKAWNVKNSDGRFSLEKRKRLSLDRFPSEIESYTTHIALQWIDWNPNMNVHFWVLTQISQLAKRLNSGNEIQFLFFAQRNNFQWLSCSFHNKF